MSNNNNINFESHYAANNISNKPVLQFDDSVKIRIILQFSYSSHEKTIENYNVRIEEKKQILINEIIDDLIGQGYSYLNNSVMSYFDEDLQTYIYLGIAPLQANIKLNFDYVKYKNNNKEIFVLRLKSRQIIKKDNLMRMELLEGVTENIDENNQNVHINANSKRSKERKIGYIIEKVYLWRKLYNGFTDNNGNFIKLTLEEAAEKVGISKKSLDDYLIQLRYLNISELFIRLILRIGKNNNFVFNEHKNDKVGVLRAFVKKHKNMEDKK